MLLKCSISTLKTLVANNHLTMPTMAVYINNDTRAIVVGALCLVGFLFGSFCLFNLDITCRQLLHESCLSKREAMCVFSMIDHKEGLHQIDGSNRTTDFMDNIWCDGDTTSRLAELLNKALER